MKKLIPKDKLAWEYTDVKGTRSNEFIRYYKDHPTIDWFSIYYYIDTSYNTEAESCKICVSYKNKNIERRSCYGENYTMEQIHRHLMSKNYPASYVLGIKFQNLKNRIKGIFKKDE